MVRMVVVVVIGMAWLSAAGWGQTPNPAADLNGDGIIDSTDLWLLMRQWFQEGPTIAPTPAITVVPGSPTATPAGTIAPTTGDPALFPPYAQAEWPSQHRDAHNSDILPRTLGQLDQNQDFTEVAWLLREATNPTIEMVGASIGQVSGTPVLFVTTGKIKFPNLYAFNMLDGQLLWHAAISAATALDAGPDSVALTSGPLLDDDGRIFISDGHFLFCYPTAPNLNAEGNQRYLWKRVMPNLTVWNEQEQKWFPTTDPYSGITLARPFLTLIFTPEVNGQAYFGGVSLDGDVFIFDRDTGDLFASAMLRSPAPDLIHGVTGATPCDPYVYAASDDPMAYDPTGHKADKLTMFGIWSTGSNTDDPDLDYFMNPCQLAAYLSVNTFGGGAMSTNTPAIHPDPSCPGCASIYVTGTQSEELAQFDVDPETPDSLIYRIDFNPQAASPEERLIVVNYTYDEQGHPKFDGRMPNGKNSAASPNLPGNGKWLTTADANGNLFVFSTADGSIKYTTHIGQLLGSATLMQLPDEDGLTKFYAFADSTVWGFGFNPETGELGKDPLTGLPQVRQLDYRDYVVEHTWRDDDPGYSQIWLNNNHRPYAKKAMAGSLITASLDKVTMLYTVGWGNPDDPTGLLVIPTHSAIMALDRSKFFSAADAASTVEAIYRDLSGSSECGIMFNTVNQPRAVVYYGSQSTSMAQFTDVNDGMPEGMKSLYIKPYGGTRLVIPHYSP